MLEDRCFTDRCMNMRLGSLIAKNRLDIKITRNALFCIASCMRALSNTIHVITNDVIVEILPHKDRDCDQAQ